jgi:hypothetical protein
VISPQFSAEPVILVHLTNEHTRAVCADTIALPDDPEWYRWVPRVLCPACALYERIRETGNDDGRPLHP